jgi:hypothetical protein
MSLGVVDEDSESRLSVEFAGEWHHLDPQRAFTIGREADLSVDDNPFLHRRFLQLSNSHGFWWLANVGGSLPATLTAADQGVIASLAPGSRLPVVFPLTYVRFSARSTSYEIGLYLECAPFEPQQLEFVGPASSTTLGRVSLNSEQRQLLAALAEPTLCRGGTGATELPSNAAVARRLSWSITKLNRKLDYLCEKLTKAGVAGLHGAGQQLASSRRARLVEYAISTRLITLIDLDELPRQFPQPTSPRDSPGAAKPH